MPNETPNTNNGFIVVDTIKDPDGIVAVVTENMRDGRVSFSIEKEYDKNGKVHRTQYLGRRHVPAVRRLLADLEERMELHEDRARARNRTVAK